MGCGLVGVGGGGLVNRLLHFTSQNLKYYIKRVEEAACVIFLVLRVLKLF